jgi:hypothetical protein
VNRTIFHRTPRERIDEMLAQGLARIQHELNAVNELVDGLCFLARLVQEHVQVEGTIGDNRRGPRGDFCSQRSQFGRMALIAIGQFFCQLLFVVFALARQNFVASGLVSRELLHDAMEFGFRLRARFLGAATLVSPERCFTFIKFLANALVR